MRTSKARTIATSLVFVGGIVVGAAPIAAQEMAPPDTTSTQTRTPTVAAPSTTLPPRQPTVQAPTTTIVSTPPTTSPTTTSTPAIPSTTATTLPGAVQAPSDGQQTPPSLPPDTPPSLPEDICKEWDVCGPPPPMPSLPQPIEVEDDPTIAAPIMTTAVPARSFAANDASALRDGLQIYRALKLDAAIVKVAALINSAIDSFTGDPGASSAPEGEGEEEGGECIVIQYEVCIDFNGDGEDDECWTEETSCPAEEE